MTDEEMLAHATEFTLIALTRGRPYNHISELRVAWRGEDAWAIIDTGFSLNHDGLWEYEPMPSSRDEDFCRRCRWPSARTAIAFAQDHMAKYPSGYRDDDDQLSDDEQLADKHQP